MCGWEEGRAVEGGSPKMVPGEQEAGKNAEIKCARTISRLSHYRCLTLTTVYTVDEALSFVYALLHLD